jgi:hypothetical protein
MCNGHCGRPNYDVRFISDISIEGGATDVQKLIALHIILTQKSREFSVKMLSRTHLTLGANPKADMAQKKAMWWRTDKIPLASVWDVGRRSRPLTFADDATIG